jgi:hypothetical protein
MSSAKNLLEVPEVIAGNAKSGHWFFKGKKQASWYTMPLWQC